MVEKVFVPHSECGAADGRCFEEGRCLMRCQPRLPVRDANAQLAAAVRLLGIFVRHERTHGHSVPGSWMDNALNEAEGLIKCNTR